MSAFVCMCFSFQILKMYFLVFQICSISVEQLAVSEIFALSKTICYFVCFIRLYYCFRFSVALLWSSYVCVFFIYLALKFSDLLLSPISFGKLTAIISSIAASLLFSLCMEFRYTCITSSHHTSISYIYYFIFILFSPDALFLNFLSNFQFTNSPVECNLLLTHSLKLYF